MFYCYYVTQIFFYFLEYSKIWVIILISKRQIEASKGVLGEQEKMVNLNWRETKLGVHLIMYISGHKWGNNEKISTGTRGKYWQF